MRMPFKQQAPPSRMERLRCGVSSRAADAAHSAQAFAVRARPMAGDAAAAAQSAAMSVSEAATTAAHSVADAAGVAAARAADRTRPVVAEAALRGGAAWEILRHGAPRSAGMTRIAGLVPVAVMGRAGRSAVRSRTGSAVTLMALGGIGAAGVMWWRRSRLAGDSVWIIDEADGDIEPPDGWHESSARTGGRAGDSRAAADGVADRAADLADSDSGRKRSDTWP